MIRLRAVPPTLTVAAALAFAAIGCSSAPEPVLTCANPLPVGGAYDPVAPGYGVSFHDNVDTPVEAARLADRYEFTITYMNRSTRSFVADFDDDVREQLRCEPSILYLEHNSHIVVD
jgi:hypothetical protein